MKSNELNAMEKGVSLSKDVLETKIGGFTVSFWCEELARMEGMFGCVSLIVATVLQLVIDSENNCMTGWYASRPFVLYLFATGALSIIEALVLFFGTKKESATLLAGSAGMYAFSFVGHIRQIIRYGILAKFNVFMLIGLIGAPISLFMTVIIMCRYADIIERRDSDEDELTV